MTRRRQQEELVTLFPAIILGSSGREHVYTFENMPPIREEYAKKPLIIRVERAYLRTGDYTLKGCEHLITIERKELSDAFRTFTAERDRFERELDRMRDIPHSYMLIEADLRTILNPSKFIPGWKSKADPKSVYGSILAWQFRYPSIQWIYAGSRRLAEIYAFSIFDRAVREGILDQS